ncbi:hypothetical protein C8R45DRAFT_942513 [Mycena sanguinolenta]|nr:hypothetical protein C8R45DRAFT_942513 [Mycena sanguinolenta]
MAFALRSSLPSCSAYEATFFSASPKAYAGQREMWRSGGIINKSGELRADAAGLIGIAAPDHGSYRSATRARVAQLAHCSTSFAPSSECGSGAWSTHLRENAISKGGTWFRHWPNLEPELRVQFGSADSSSLNWQRMKQKAREAREVVHEPGHPHLTALYLTPYVHGFSLVWSPTSYGVILCTWIKRSEIEWEFKPRRVEHTHLQPD